MVETSEIEVHIGTSTRKPGAGIGTHHRPYRSARPIRDDTEQVKLTRTATAADTRSYGMPVAEGSIATGRHSRALLLTTVYP